jgi:hypothetical protein
MAGVTIASLAAGTNENDISNYSTDDSGNLYKESTTLTFDESAVIHAGDKNIKRCNSQEKGEYYIEEIRPPYLRRTPHENTIILDMVDSNKKEIMIELEDGTLITALKMAPNPETMSINSSKIINRYNTMTRWVEEHWGDNLDIINFSGSTYSFCAMLENGSYSGLTLAKRDSSVAFKYLKSLVRFFRTNGCLYQETNVYALNNPSDTEGYDYEYDRMNKYLLDNYDARGNHPRHGLLRERMYIRIRFDFVTYIGHFENFDISENASTPFRLTYNINFKSEKMIWNNSL